MLSLLISMSKSVTSASYEVTYTTRVAPHSECTERATTRVEANRLFRQRRKEWIYVKLFQVVSTKTELRSSK